MNEVEVSGFIAGVRIPKTAAKERHKIPCGKATRKLLVSYYFIQVKFLFTYCVVFLVVYPLKNQNYHFQLSK